MKKKSYISKVVVVAVMLCLIFTMAAPVSAATKLAKPTNVKVVLTAKYTSKITWNKVKDAKSYEVYYSVNGSKYKKLKTTTQRTVNQKKLAAGKTYSYKVRAIKGKTKSAYSAVKKVKTIGSTSPKLTATPYKNVDDANMALLKWNKVKNATGYKVYKKADDGYKLLKTTTANIYKDPNGGLGTKYTYKVVPYIKVNGKTFNGTASIKAITTRSSGYLMDISKPYRVEHGYYYYSCENSTIRLAGEEYSHGFYIEDNWGSPNSVYFNLGGKYRTLSFISGVPDSGDNYDGKVSIYIDGDLVYSYTYEAADLPRKHTIDVSDCMQLKICVEVEEFGFNYAFVDIIVTK